MLDKNLVLEHTKKEFRWSFVLSALVLIGLGVVFLLHPTQVGNLLCYLVGGVLVAYGAFNIISFFMAKERRLTIALLIGVVTAALGVFILLSPGSVFNAIQVILGLMVVIDGIMNIKRALVLKKMEAKLWQISLVLPIISIIFGILLMIQRDIFGTALFVVIGILLIYQGVSDLVGIIHIGVWGKKLFRKLDKAAEREEALED